MLHSFDGYSDRRQKIKHEKREKRMRQGRQIIMQLIIISGTKKANSYFILGEQKQTTPLRDGRIQEPFWKRGRNES
jgi:hypothetical protein